MFVHIVHNLNVVHIGNMLHTALTVPVARRRPTDPMRHSPRLTPPGPASPVVHRHNIAERDRMLQEHHETRFRRHLPVI